MYILNLTVGNIFSDIMFVPTTVIDTIVVGLSQLFENNYGNNRCLQE